MTNDKISGSVTNLLNDLKNGDRDAANQIISRYYERVVSAASARLKKRGIRISDGEDVAASVFESLWTKASEKKYANTDLQDREDLWKLLCRLMNSKTIDIIRRETAKKRGSGLVRGESVFQRPPGEPMNGIDKQAGSDISPEQNALLAERHELLMDQLGTDDAREIVTLRLEGHDLIEIAERMNVSTRTVKRKLQSARDAWLRITAQDE